MAGLKAAVSIAFSPSVYKAIYSFRPLTESHVDLNVKQRIVSLMLMLATSFSARA